MKTTSIILVLVITVFCFVLSVEAGSRGKNRSIKGHVLYSQCDDIVEQQTKFVDLQPVEPIVHNILRPEYMWNVDDSWRYVASGRMAAGQTFSISKHFVADNQGHLFGIHGTVSRHRSFKVKLSIPEIGFTYEGVYERSGGFCLVGPFFNIDDSRLTPIEGSNGVGILCTAIFEITAIDKFNKAGFFFDIGYPNHQRMDGICGGHNTEIISWSPTWRLVQ